MFRARRPDPFSGLYEEAYRQREDRRRGSFLSQVVHSDGASLLDVTDRIERSPSSHGSALSRRHSELVSPFRFRHHIKKAEKHKLKRYPTVSASSAYVKLHPNELGFKTIGDDTRRAKDIRFPVYLTNNEAKQEQQLLEVEARERKLDYIKNSQIVYDYTEEGQKKKNIKKNKKARAASKQGKAIKKQPNVKRKAKSRSKVNDDLETILADDIGSQYTFETLPENANFDYLIESEEVPPGATHGKISKKPVRLVRKEEKGSTRRVRAPVGSSPEVASETTPESAPVAGSKFQDISGDTYEHFGVPQEQREEREFSEAQEQQEEREFNEAQEQDEEGDFSEAQEEREFNEAQEQDEEGDFSEAQEEHDEGDPVDDSVAKATRFKDGPVEQIPDAIRPEEGVSDVVVVAAEEEINPKAHPGLVSVAVEEEIIEPPIQREEKEEEMIGTPETPEDDEECDSTPGSMISDVNSEASSISPPADHTAMPRVIAFPETDKKRNSFAVGGRRKRKMDRSSNPLATPQNPELLVKTDREGFLSKGVYDKVRYENLQHSKWLAEFVEAEKQRCADKEVDYNNKLLNLKKEVRKLEESMQDVEDDANELIEIRSCRLSRKLMEETQKYVEKKNEIFHETKYIQDEKDKETGAIKEKQKEVQKEIDILNSEKDSVHREFIGWTNRLGDLSAHLDAEMHKLLQLEQSRMGTRTQISELSRKKAALEEEMIGYNSTHAKNTKQLERIANKEYLPEIHEIDFKISNLLNELSVVKQETANEKVKVASITKQLDDERKAHEEKLKLEAEEREREERNLLGKQREEHENAAAELKKQHEMELERMRQDYEKQLQELKERQEREAAEAEAARQRAEEAEAAREEATRAAGVKAERAKSVATEANATKTDIAKTEDTKLEVAEAEAAEAEAKKAETEAKKTEAANAAVTKKEATGATAAKAEATRAVVAKVEAAKAKAAKAEATKTSESTATEENEPENPFVETDLTTPGETSEFTDDPNKPNESAPHEARQSVGSFAASYCTANDNKRNPTGSRESSLFDYETEEEVRTVNS